MHERFAADSRAATAREVNLDRFRAPMQPAYRQPVPAKDGMADILSMLAEDDELTSRSDRARGYEFDDSWEL